MLAFSNRALCLTVALGLASLAAAAAAQDISTIVAQALDQNVKSLAIEDQPMRAALAELEQQTGVRVVIPDDVLALLPYGDRTQVTLKLADVPLRSGLERAFESLGLTYRIERDRVVLEPLPVLARIGRRLTIDEAQLLGRLAADQPPGEGAHTALQFRMPEPQEAERRFAAALRQTAGANGLRQLEAAATSLDWVWVIDRDAIVLYPAADFVRQQLDRPLNLNLQRLPLDELLVQVAARAGVRMSFEPGSLRRVNAQDQVVDLVQRDVTLRQVLERIAGNTGLQYEIADGGVRILGPRGRGEGGGQRGRVIAHLIVQLEDGKSLLMPIREGELSPDEVERLEHTRMEGIRATRAFLARQDAAGEAPAASQP